MSETKHTPTPWLIDEYGGITYSGSRKNHHLPVNGVEFSCSPGARMDEAKANAAHIVLCVNSHDALVSALKAARPMLSDDYEFSVIMGSGMEAEEIGEVIDAIDAALKLAEA
jgi:hypothetical protein